MQHTLVCLSPTWYHHRNYLLSDISVRVVNFKIFLLLIKCLKCVAMRPSIVLSCILVFITYASGTLEQNENTVQSLTKHQFEENFVKKLNWKCTQRDNSSCIMLKWLAYMNRLFKKSSMEFGHLEITQSSDAVAKDDTFDDMTLARAARTDDEALSFIIADKLWNFVRSRTLRYKMFDDADMIVSSEPRGNLNIGLSINPQGAFESGRGRMRHLAPLMAAIATKIGVIGLLVFKGLVLLVGKALIVSKVALILALIIGFKKLLSKKHVTYEVVSHPHHAESHVGHHDSYSSGWGRALDGFFEGLEATNVHPPADAQSQAYSGQQKNLS